MWQTKAETNISSIKLLLLYHKKPTRSLTFLKKVKRKMKLKDNKKESPLSSVFIGIWSIDVLDLGSSGNLSGAKHWKKEKAQHMSTPNLKKYVPNHS